MMGPCLEPSIVTCLLMCLVTFMGLSAGEDVCNGYDFNAGCASGEILMVEEALFGRMDPGACLPENSDNLGCQNVVLNLLDRWCSGQPQCQLNVPNRDIMDANTDCSKNFASFLRVTYTCLRDARSDIGTCSRSKPVTLTSASGHLSSHVTDKTGCGSTKSPWVLQAQPGQTIELTLLDFSALDRARSHSLSSCSQVYGFILERALSINHTICGSKERESVIYTSKTNSVEIHVVQKTGATFVLRYSANGCQEPIPPPHAWYKRNGNEAVIGCESNNKQRQLACSGTTWRGNVGNCTNFIVQPGLVEDKADLKFELSSVVIVAAIIGGTIVLAVAVVVCGVIYLHKYRDRQEGKHSETLTLQAKTPAATLPRTHYRPVSAQEEYLQPSAQTMTLQTKPNDPLIHIWETSLPKPNDPNSRSTTNQTPGNIGTTNQTSGMVANQRTGGTDTANHRSGHHTGSVHNIMDSALTVGVTTVQILDTSITCWTGMLRQTMHISYSPLCCCTSIV